MSYLILRQSCDIEVMRLYDADEMQFNLLTSSPNHFIALISRFKIEYFACRLFQNQAFKMWVQVIYKMSQLQINIGINLMIYEEKRFNKVGIRMVSK